MILDKLLPSALATAAPRPRFTRRQFVATSVGGVAGWPSSR